MWDEFYLLNHFPSDPNLSLCHILPSELSHLTFNTAMNPSLALIILMYVCVVFFHSTLRLFNFDVTNAPFSQK